VQQAAKHRLVEIEVREPVLATLTCLRRAGREACGGESLDRTEVAEAGVELNARESWDAELLGALDIRGAVHASPPTDEQKLAPPVVRKQAQEPPPQLLVPVMQ
jgi:hypothetical protein